MSRPRRRAAAVGLLGALLVGPWLVGGAAALAAPAPPVPGRAAGGPALASGALREAVARLEAGRPVGGGVEVEGSRVRVEVLHHVTDGQARAAVVGAGGEVEGDVPGSVVQALVPAGRLAALEAAPGIDFVRPPLDMAEPAAPDGAGDEGPGGTGTAVVGEEVAKTNAAAWLAAGHRGAGVKVGIIDSFSGSHWSSAQSAGEVPAPAGTFCRVNGSSCDIFVGDKHGVGVAEVIHEMAPGAALYLATARSAADLQAAVDFFVTQGVRIISRSQTAQYDGRGDGTGPIANVVNNAVSRGITWFNSAGNSAGSSANPGTYWRFGFSDPDGDGFHNFSATDEQFGFDCSFINGLRWSDWGTNRTDYDIYVFDDPNLTVLESRSEDDQSSGAPPLEHPGCSAGSAGDVDFMVVRLFNAGGGTAGDVLEIMTNGSATEYWQTPFSATGPIAETNSTGALSVGAVDPATGTTIAAYSSQGPTNDNRTKPDLSAAACVQSFTYSPSCFNGTSSSTPAVAGAAALVLGAGQASSPAGLKTYLLNATVDRGPAGTDNAYGRGELRLPTPPGGTAPANDAFASATALSASPGTTTGSNVGATKQSGEPSHAGNAGGASVWFRWTPSVSGRATVDTVGSGFDTLLGIYTGTAVNGLTQVAADDDSGGSLTSRASFDARAGTTYRIAVDGFNGGGGAATGSIALRWALTPNQAPTARAGPDQTVGSGAAFDLDASGSTDPEGAPLAFLWSQVSGPAATIQNPTSARTRVNGVSGPATLVFRVTVTDSFGATSSDSVTITVSSPK